jgi:dolichol-phosphate mannosyltransferase
MDNLNSLSCDKISVITPAYNEAGNLPTLYQRLLLAMDTQNADWEWIIVDDHSSDKTFAVIDKLAQSDERVRGIRFAKNSGSHVSILCGIGHAVGRCAVVMAADLQDPPETIIPMLDKWRDGAKVVWAARAAREGESAGTLAFSRLYYWIMRNIVGIKEMPATGADFFLIDRVVMDALNQYKEGNVQIMALIIWMGFEQESITYDKQARASGSSGWSFEKKIKLVVDSILSFSYLPVRLMSYIGFITALVGFCYAILVVFLAIVGKRVGEGWASLMVVILVMGGMQMLMMGVLGEYIWRTLDESRRRPRYLIEKMTAQKSQKD